VCFLGEDYKDGISVNDRTILMAIGNYFKLVQIQLNANYKFEATVQKCLLPKSGSNKLTALEKLRFNPFQR